MASDTPALPAQTRHRVTEALRPVEAAAHDCGRMDQFRHVPVAYRQKLERAREGFLTELARLHQELEERTRLSLWLVLDVCDEPYRMGEEFRGVFASEEAAKDHATGMLFGEARWMKVGDEWQAASTGGYVCVRPVAVEGAAAPGGIPS